MVIWLWILSVLVGLELILIFLLARAVAAALERQQMVTNALIDLSNKEFAKQLNKEGIQAEFFEGTRSTL